MGERDSSALSQLALLIGCVGTLLLSLTAAIGLWLDFAHSPDASLAWDDIEALQADIERGLLMADLRRSLSILAIGVTMVWFALTMAARRLMAFATALVVGLALVGWWARGEIASPRSLFESAAAAVALAVVLAAFWLQSRKPRAGPGSELWQSATGVPRQTS